MNIYRILLILAFSFAFAESKAETKELDGYGKTNWEMSESKVMEVESERIKKMELPDVIDHLIGSLQIDDIEIAGQKFNAILYFDNQTNKLARVNITPKVETGPRMDAFMYGEISELLTGKYGPPTHKNDDNLGYSYSASWLLTKTQITLRHITIYNTSALTINYEPAQAGVDAAKDL